MLGKPEKEPSRYITAVSERNAERLKTYIPTPTPLFEAFYYMGIFGYIWECLGEIIRTISYEPLAYPLPVSLFVFLLSFLDDTVDYSYPN